MENKTISKKLFLVILVSFSLFILITGCEEQEQEKPEEPTPGPGLTPSTDSGPPAPDTTTPSQEYTPPAEPPTYYECSGDCYCDTFLGCNRGYTRTSTKCKGGLFGIVAGTCCCKEESTTPSDEEEGEEEVEEPEEEPEEGGQIPVTEPTETTTIKGKYIILNENFPDDVYSSPIAFYTGVLPSGKIVRTLINFDLRNIKNKEIKDAKLVINKVYLLEGDEYGKQAVAVHKVMEKWDFNTAKWNNKPSFDITPVSSQSIIENGRYSFDITSIINYLIEKNQGVLLKAHYENEPNLKRFNGAYLNIWYIE